jgi:hypothetical protein
MRDVNVESTDGDLGQQEPLNDRPFVPSRIAASAPGMSVVDDVLVQLQNFESHAKARKRRRRAPDQQVFERTVEALICDAIERHLVDPEGQVSISLSHRDLGRRSRYRPSVMSKALPDILKRLGTPEMAFLEVELGMKGYGFAPDKRTSFKAGSRLISRIAESGLTLADLGRDQVGEVIVLKREKEGPFDKGEAVDYLDTEQTNAFRREVEAINRRLWDADLGVDHAALGATSVDLSDRSLRRYFNNRRFDHGGRLFGGYWMNVPSEVRPLALRINGERIVTIDYKQMAPRLLYARLGLTPPSDCYLIPDHEHLRDGWKKLLNAMLHSGPGIRRYPKGVRALFPDDMKCSEAVGLLLDFHAPIVPHLYPDLGLELMFAESEILIDVLLELGEQGITALPIHDAVLAPRSKAEIVEEVMVDVFREHTGIEGQVTVSASSD